MRTSEPGKEFIKDFEGCKLEAYQCSGGVWTIGYGHTRHVQEGDKITSKEADAFLVKDIEMVEHHVNRLVNVHLLTNEWDAVVSWCFNLGCGNLRASTMLRVINAGDIDKVSEQIVRWDKAGGKVVAGLTRRRKAEAQLFDDAVYDHKPKESKPKAKAKSNG
jgi:lysozyme